MPKPPGEIERSEPSGRDLFEIALTLGRSSRATADRFLAATEATLARLAAFPGLGEPWVDDEPELSDVRCSRVDGFRHHVIYYRPVDGGIEVLRVVHSARDIRRADLAGDPPG